MINIKLTEREAQIVFTALDRLQTEAANTPRGVELEGADPSETLPVAYSSEISPLRLRVEARLIKLHERSSRKFGP